MEYKEFLDRLQKIAKPYSHIKIPKYTGNDDSAVERVPDAFINLLDCVLQIIYANIKKFCDPNTQDIVLFGLQPAAGMYTTKENDEHYCCTLDYYLIRKNSEPSRNSHKMTHTLVIDFTIGAVISDVDYCVSVASQTRLTTPTYGTIPAARLQDAWTNIIDNQNLNDPSIKEIQQFYLPTYLKYQQKNRTPSLTMPYLAAVLIFNEPRWKTNFRHEAPSDASAAKLRRPDRLTKSGDEDISHTRLYFSSSL